MQSLGLKQDRELFEIGSTYEERSVTVSRTFLTRTFWQTCSFYPAKDVLRGKVMVVNLVCWRFSAGSAPLNERSSREGNGGKVRALQLSCSRRSNRGEGAKRCEWEKQRGGGVGGERFPPLSLSLTSLSFLLLSHFALNSTIWTPGTVYLLYNQTASYTGFQRSRLNKLKNFLLLLQIAINTTTYVTTSTTILNSFHSVYIHLLKCPPQRNCPPLPFYRICDIPFTCILNWTLCRSTCVKKLIFL